jgi:AraC-like DNA-binding protein
MTSASPQFSQRILFQNSTTTPLGAITLAGMIEHSRGPGQVKDRRLGKYCLVYSLKGSASYCDELGGKRLIRPGDLFFVFPEIAHRYGYVEGETWDEFFILFEGPLFDTWRAQGLLEPGSAFFHLEPINFWLQRLRSCLETPYPPGLQASLDRVTRLQALLVEILFQKGGGKEVPPDWVSQACLNLEDARHRSASLGELAALAGVSQETFRKTFARFMGISPGAYRSAKVIDAACRMLIAEPVPGKIIASRLGFADEYHFSKRFKAVTGYSPSAFRQRLFGDEVKPAQTSS